MSLHVHPCSSCDNDEVCARDCWIVPAFGQSHDGLPRGFDELCSRCEPPALEPDEGAADDEMTA